MRAKNISWPSLTRSSRHTIRQQPTQHCFFILFAFHVTVFVDVKNKHILKIEEIKDLEECCSGQI